MTNALAGRKALVIGVANDKSIAWGIASALRAAGAELAITYLNPKAEPHVRPLAEKLDARIVAPLDVARPDDEDALFNKIATEWDRLDVVVHSIAYAPRDDLHGRVIDSTAEGFGLAMDVSVHSFARLCRRAEPLMRAGGSCLTVSYYGAEKVISTYNMMGPVKAALEATARELASELGPSGVRVNVLSPGAMATRAAGGIAEFDAMLEATIERSPMGRLASIEDVGATAAFLASDGARSITGETIHVDAGYHIMG
ncbi:enoyl-[acyl-carrier-protein] reductase [NADH] [Alsobacter metallidurans]|uniref:Enoyl-[acyl-carrier-protein] reductase [NADH] n=1 Tax=Alsobacter metallidurans TaxID=340221 RepID=A0A917MIG4_9HYPH|nr:enoyl-ACP reductase FabI [Alsobacter metallidurans]GGH11243.1 enoyl-[acyl-carrier-protein] reductase [NADH] [Alsobacter metallidurans]